MTLKIQELLSLLNQSLLNFSTGAMLLIPTLENLKMMMDNFFMTTEDVDLAARALLEFINAQHSGEENILHVRQSALKVRIRKHSSLPGLFFSSSVIIFVYVLFIHLIFIY